MKQSKIVRWYCILAAVIFIFLIYANYTYKNEEINSYDLREITTCDIDRSYRMENGSFIPIELPVKSRIKAGETYSLVITLPDTGDEGSVLCFKSNHLLINAYIDDNRIYSFGVDERNTIGKSPGCAFCFIPITSNNYGKEIIIEYTAIYNNASKHIGSFLFGEKTTLVLALIRNGIFPLIICALLFFAGIIFIVVYLTRFQTTMVEKSLLYLGLSAIPIAIWSSVETQLLQFFISNVYMIQYITYLSLGLIGLPFLLYFAELHKKANSKIVQIISILTISCTGLIFTLQVLGIKDLPELLWALHGNIIIIIFYCILSICFQGNPFYSKGRQNKIITSFPMIFLLLCCIIDVARYYFKVKGDYSKFVRVGFIVYILCEGFKSMMQVSELKKENEQLENLAYQDALTGLNNNAAFKLKCVNLMEELPGNKEVGIVDLKITNLSQIEKLYGDIAMEEVIQTASKLIQLSFAHLGDVYRTSEDEFAVIIRTNIVTAFQSGEKLLEQRLKNCNQSRVEKISISCELKELMINSIPGNVI